MIGVNRLALLFALGVFVACREARTRPDSTTSDNAPANARALLSRGDAVYGRGEFDSARAIYTHARDRAATTGDTLAQARALTSMGLAAWRHGDYADAHMFGERAVSLKIAAGLTKELPKSYNALGLLAHNQGRFAEALDAYARAEQAAEATSDSVWLAKVRGNRGLVYSDIGDFSNARRGFEALRRLAHNASDTTLEANALNNLGMVDIREGSPRDAFALLFDALQLHRAIGNAVGQENALGQLGTAYDAIGDPQRALAYLDSALRTAERHGLRQQESDDLQLIAAIYSDAGDHARALEFLSRAAAVADSMDMRKIQGDIARAQARTLVALGDFRTGRARVDAATRFHADAGAALEQLEDETVAAELTQRNGAAREADVALASARRLAMSIDSRVARIELAVGEARVAQLRGDATSALRSLTRVRDDLAATSGAGMWEVPALTARAYASLGRLTESANAGRAAVSAVERVRGNFAAGSLRSSFTAARAEVYADLVVTLLRQGRTSEALSVADAARSRALLEHLTAVGRDSARRGSASDLVAAEQLLRRIDVLVEKLRVADTVSPQRRTRPTDEEAGFLSRQLADTRRDYETLIRRAGVADRRTSAIIGTTLPNGVALRSALRPDEALLEYLVTPTKLVTFIVTASAVRAIETATTEETVASRVRLARDLLARRDTATAIARPALRQLYQLLIRPALDSVRLPDVRSLVIVPHGALAYLPFSALVDPVSDRYLVERYDLLLSPSAASLAAVRQSRPERGDGFAATSVFAPFPEELPGTRAEVEALGHLGDSARSYVGAAATERALRRALAEPRPVHVATHGILNPRSPMFSRLDVARAQAGPDGAVPADDDGRLEVHELLDLTIRSPLVFLSGCETGAGAAWSTSFNRGDDYATLAEAFLFAGARNVVSTLWRIDDRGAAVFASAFYREAADRSPTEALARAQRAMIADPEHARPYYWAAYFVTGDGRPMAQNRVAVSVK